jgi:hopene-associated glycosyltransferase HpnB
MIAAGLAAVALLIWIYLLLGRGMFWLGRERDDRLVPPGTPDLPHWPRVTAIVPARNEAESIAACIGSLLAQDYPGEFRVLLVDDQSTDGTADLAREAAARQGALGRLEILTGTTLPGGWTGKLWAMTQGSSHVEAEAERPDFILFSDADIAYAPDVLTRLARGAEARGLGLVSMMAKLNCTSPAERWLVPAFVFFFQKLYPFFWNNDPKQRTAGAAGGCMLVRREVLLRAGGLARIRDALIDDCALGALIKREAPIWLALTERVVSLRPYPDFNDLRRMVVRSAYAELGYSPLRLVGAVLGMCLTYLLPPGMALFAGGPAAILGAVTWALMVVAFAPMLRFYGLSPLRGLALPLIAATYTGFTVESAWAHARGRGGAWKGRFQAKGAESTEQA